MGGVGKACWNRWILVPPWPHPQPLMESRVSLTALLNLDVQIKEFVMVHEEGMALRRCCQKKKHSSINSRSASTSQASVCGRSSNNSDATPLGCFAGMPVRQSSRLSPALGASRRKMSPKTRSFPQPRDIFYLPHHICPAVHAALYFAQDTDTA